MLFNIALNYGGRAEIVEAARRAAGRRASRPTSSTRQRFAGFLYTAGQPDPDLLIRTSGEMRVSNFLLWQIAYAEIWVTDTLWPDFRKRHLLEAVLAYQKRDRRYGGITQPAVAGALMTPRAQRACDPRAALAAAASAPVWFLRPSRRWSWRVSSRPLAFLEYVALAAALGARVPRARAGAGVSPRARRVGGRMALDSSSVPADAR